MNRNDELLPCPECEGSGWVVGTRHACCGKLSPSGGCWGGCAVQEQYQEICYHCDGSGQFEYPTEAISRAVSKETEHG